jgi:hypothetical protein
MIEPTQLDWARLAAFIDGEGSILITERRTPYQWYSRLAVCIANTDPRLPAWCKERFGGRIQVRSRHKENKRTVWTWTAQAKIAEKAIRGCLPYFILKREQADIALIFRTTFKLERGHGRFKSLTTEVLQVRQTCKSELYRLKRELPQLVLDSAIKPKEERIN